MASASALRSAAGPSCRCTETISRPMGAALRQAAPLRRRQQQRVAAVAQGREQRQAPAAAPPQPRRAAAALPALPVAAAAAALAALAAAAGPAAAAVQPLAAVADLDAATAHSLETVLRPLFAIGTVLYIIRIPMTWYPSIDGTKLPWLFAYAPTEPILRATRKARGGGAASARRRAGGARGGVIPLVGGVDVTPIVWVGLLSFLNEILLGPQGILMLIQRQSGAGLL
ncbi:cofactor assembly of complex C subunit B, chloroplastic [Raphidocelis subcapitata]|uniref:Cofactor assembly of complex C subunit B, chloroplastic n=1 Tax=Raphidocelis subcapitata TaxID=307507 RepID=A0A2V0NNZ7_9CHLO|nr:cofactor assembly of complex C subunit B, chloroplastic [Raphidocelis subcapitata]|eukprot:GBF89306.1 cofactor assembly of complex C subunit B, chloroplastic [Raphidocelis subcapitata]